MSKDHKYRWVWQSDGARLYNVGILADGRVHNPNGYPEDIVRESVLAADARRHERRNRAAKKASETRAIRQERKVYDVAHKILAGNKIGPLPNCYICGRGLSDPESIERGIGSECWQDVLQAITKHRRQSQQ